MQLASKLGSMFEHNDLGLLAVVIKQTEVKMAGYVYTQVRLQSTFVCSIQM